MKANLFWLPLARAAWLIVAALTVVLYVGGLHTFYHQQRVVCAAEPCRTSPTTAQAQLLAQAGVSLQAAARYEVAVYALAALVHVAVAALLFWRRSEDPMAVFVSVMLLTFGTFGIHSTATIDAVLSAVGPAWRVPVTFISLLGACTITLFWFLFPDGRFVPRGLRTPVILWLLWDTFTSVVPNTHLDPERWPAGPNLVYWLLTLVTCLYALVFRYRRISTPAQRQQTKWVVFGAVVSQTSGMAAYGVTVLAPVLDPRLAPLALFQDTSCPLFVAVMPVVIAIAILRSRLFDIDFVINRALVYSLLTAALALIYGGLVIGLQALFHALTGETPQVVIIASTLAIVGLFQPLRRAIQSFIDRRFYRRKYDVQQVLAGFASRLRGDTYTDLEHLTQALESVVNDTVQPAHISLQLWDGSPARRTAETPGTSARRAGL
jgi:hypothetical protein